MCWIYATTTTFNCSVFTEETFKGAGGVVVPRLLEAWFDLEGSRGAEGSPGHARLNGVDLGLRRRNLVEGICNKIEYAEMRIKYAEYAP
jgi:hypothetical protein